MLVVFRRHEEEEERRRSRRRDSRRLNPKHDEPWLIAACNKKLGRSSSARAPRALSAAPSRSRISNGTHASSICSTLLPTTVSQSSSLAPLYLPLFAAFPLSPTCHPIFVVIPHPSRLRLPFIHFHAPSFLFQFTLACGIRVVPIC